MKQPEALRLADALDCHEHIGMSKAAAELRRLHEAEEHNRKYVATLEKEVTRLHEANQAMLEALKQLVNGHGFAPGHSIEKARAAIAKGETSNDH